MKQIRVVTILLVCGMFMGSFFGLSSKARSTKPKLTVVKDTPKEIEKVLNYEDSLFRRMASKQLALGNAFKFHSIKISYFDYDITIPPDPSRFGSINQKQKGNSEPYCNITLEAKYINLNQKSQVPKSLTLSYKKRKGQCSNIPYIASKE